MSETFPDDVHETYQLAVQSIVERLEIGRHVVEHHVHFVDLYLSNDHLTKVREATHQLNEAARHAKNLAKAVRAMSETQRAEVESTGAATLPQLELLVSALNSNASYLESFVSENPRKGRRNIVAYGIAEAVRRMFRTVRRDITFGNSPEGGPSTEFGRAVEFSIGAFGIVADWRRPAEEAFRKQRKINERFHRISFHRPKRELEECPEVVKITMADNNGCRVAILSAPGFTNEFDAICTCRFPSGRHINDYAAKWFRSVSANS